MTNLVRTELNDGRPMWFDFERGIYTEEDGTPRCNHTSPKVTPDSDEARQGFPEGAGFLCTMPGGHSHDVPHQAEDAESDEGKFEPRWTEEGEWVRG